MQSLTALVCPVWTSGGTHTCTRNMWFRSLNLCFNCVGTGEKQKETRTPRPEKLKLDHVRLDWSHSNLFSENNETLSSQNVKTKNVKIDSIREYLQTAILVIQLTCHCAYWPLMTCHNKQLTPYLTVVRSEKSLQSMTLISCPWAWTKPIWISQTTWNRGLAGPNPYVHTACARTSLRQVVLVYRTGGLFSLYLSSNTCATNARQPFVCEPHNLNFTFIYFMH